jgi:F-type H+-transporting ATPase subunit delta
MRTRRQTRHDAHYLWQLCIVNGMLDENRARQVADFVAASKRSDAMAVLTEFLRLARSDDAQRTAHVASAVPLDDQARAAITAGLTQRYRSALVTVFDVDPALIGGTRVTVGSDLYDGSIQGKLAAIEQSFQDDH